MSKQEQGIEAVRQLAGDAGVEVLRDLLAMRRGIPLEDDGIRFRPDDIGRGLNGIVADGASGLWSTRGREIQHGHKETS